MKYMNTLLIINRNQKEDEVTGKESRVSICKMSRTVQANSLAMLLRVAPPGDLMRQAMRCRMAASRRWRRGEAAKAAPKLGGRTGAV